MVRQTLQFLWWLQHCCHRIGLEVPSYVLNHSWGSYKGQLLNPGKYAREPTNAQGGVVSMILAESCYLLHDAFAVQTTTHNYLYFMSNSPPPKKCVLPTAHLFGANECSSCSWFTHAIFGNSCQVPLLVPFCFLADTVISLVLQHPKGLESWCIPRDKVGTLCSHAQPLMSSQSKATAMMNGRGTSNQFDILQLASAFSFSSVFSWCSKPHFSSIVRAGNLGITG